MRETTKIPQQAASHEQDIGCAGARQFGHAHGENQKKNADRRPSGKADEAGGEIKANHDRAQKYGDRQHGWRGPLNSGKAAPAKTGTVARRGPCVHQEYRNCRFSTENQSRRGDSSLGANSCTAIAAGTLTASRRGPAKVCRRGGTSSVTTTLARSSVLHVQCRCSALARFRWPKCGKQKATKSRNRREKREDA